MNDLPPELLDINGTIPSLLTVQDSLFGDQPDDEDEFFPWQRGRIFDVKALTITNDPIKSLQPSPAEGDEDVPELIPYNSKKDKNSAKATEDSDAQEMIVHHDRCSPAKYLSISNHSKDSRVSKEPSVKQKRRNSMPSSTVENASDNNESVTQPKRRSCSSARDAKRSIRRSLSRSNKNERSSSRSVDSKRKRSKSRSSRGSSKGRSSKSSNNNDTEESIIPVEIDIKPKRSSDTRSRGTRSNSKSRRSRSLSRKSSHDENDDTSKRSLSRKSSHDENDDTSKRSASRPTDRSRSTSKRRRRSLSRGRKESTTSDEDGAEPNKESESRETGDTKSKGGPSKSLSSRGRERSNSDENAEPRRSRSRGTSVCSSKSKGRSKSLSKRKEKSTTSDESDENDQNCQSDENGAKPKRSSMKSKSKRRSKSHSNSCKTKSASDDNESKTRRSRSRSKGASTAIEVSDTSELVESKLDQLDKEIALLTDDCEQSQTKNEEGKDKDVHRKGKKKGTNEKKSSEGATDSKQRKQRKKSRRSLNSVDLVKDEVEGSSDCEQSIGSSSSFKSRRSRCQNQRLQKNLGLQKGLQQMEIYYATISDGENDDDGTTHVTKGDAQKNQEPKLPSGKEEEETTQSNKKKGDAKTKLTQKLKGYATGWGRISLPPNVKLGREVTDDLNSVDDSEKSS